MKKLKVLLSLITLISSMTITSLAGVWKSDAIGWWYENDDGGYYTSSWQWIDGNNDGIAECYCFDEIGYCYLNTITPDESTVDVNGAWTVDGIVQTKNVGVTILPSVPQAVSGNLVSTEEFFYVNDYTDSVGETRFTEEVEEPQTYETGILDYPFDGYTIVVNTNTGKYHVPGCKSVKQMKEKNKGYCDSVDYLLSIGYVPCKNCH